MTINIQAILSDLQEGVFVKGDIEQLCEAYETYGNALEDLEDALDLMNECDTVEDCKALIRNMVEVAVTARRGAKPVFEGEVLPVFTYGTLRTGQPNQRPLENIIDEAIEAQVEGMEMFDYNNGSFPVARQADGSTITGEWLYFTPEYYEEAMAYMDVLEGYDAKTPDRNMYNRIIVTDTTGRRGYMYVAGPMWDKDFDRMRKIESGDWVKDRTDSMMGWLKSLGVEESDKAGDNGENN